VSFPIFSPSFGRIQTGTTVLKSEDYVRTQELTLYMSLFWTSLMVLGFMLLCQKSRNSSTSSKRTYFIDTFYQQTLNPYLKIIILDQGYIASNLAQLILNETTVIRGKKTRNIFTLILAGTSFGYQWSAISINHSVKARYSKMNSLMKLTSGFYNL
jgi:hypothetical protein